MLIAQASKQPTRVAGARAQLYRSEGLVVVEGCDPAEQHSQVRVRCSTQPAERELYGSLVQEKDFSRQSAAPEPKGPSHRHVIRKIEAAVRGRTAI